MGKWISVLLMGLIVVVSGCAKVASPTSAAPPVPVSVGYWLIESDAVTSEINFMVHVDTSTQRVDNTTYTLFTSIDSVVVINIDTTTELLKKVSFAVRKVAESQMRDTLSWDIEFFVTGDTDVNSIYLTGHFTNDSSLNGRIIFRRQHPSDNTADVFVQGPTSLRLATSNEVNRLYTLRVGNANSHVFHTTDCFYTPTLTNAVYFWNRDSAIAAGYTADGSGKCTP